MGGVCGRKNPSDKLEKQPTAPSKIDNSKFAKKPKLNRADFRFQQQKDKFLFRERGQIDGQVFDLQDVDECTVYLHDFHN